MAIVNLSKSFSRRATGFEGDREEHEKMQAIAIGKAINGHVSAVKEKHLRTLIIGTYRDRGASTFWYNACKLPLEGDPVVAWKFCHALHKILRDGEAHVLTDSLKYKSKLNDLGRLWKHVRDDSCQLIAEYCTLLVAKSDFHQRNPQIPGNLALTAEQLDAVGQQDVNNWFELAIEVLDYLDAILALQKLVFDSLDKSRASSMTPVGQCRLAPMILCILDTSSLYDILVKILFKLYASLPSDLLSGHSDRFLVVFKGIKQFYASSSNLQYFKNLVSVPTLPENPPNFRLASDFGNYVSPEVLLHEQRSESPTESQTMDDAKLVELDTMSNFDEPSTSFRPQKVDAKQSVDREQELIALHHSLEDARTTLWRTSQEHERTKAELQSSIVRLKERLVASEETVQQLQEEHELLRQMNEQLQNDKNQLLDEKCQNNEGRLVGVEDKFRKLKEAYNSLREEHIKTLKNLTPLQGSKMELEEQCQQAESELQDCRHRLDEAKRFAEDCAAKLKLAEDDRGQMVETNKALQRDLASAADRQQGYEQLLKRIIPMLCCLGQRMVDEAVELNNIPAACRLSCPPEIFLSHIQTLQDDLTTSGDVIQPVTMDETYVDSTERLVNFMHRFSLLILYGHGIANLITSDQLDGFCSASEDAANKARSFLTTTASDQSAFEALKRALDGWQASARTLAGGVQSSDVDVDRLAELYESEIKNMEAAIVEAASKIQSILNKARSSTTGVQLAVNEKILESCTSLMQEVIRLVACANKLQNEIVQQQRGASSAKDFYRRNHEWTEGLLSAAKAVGSRVNLLVDAADRVVAEKGKFEELMVASKEIAASSVQLVISSRVKADRDSALMHELSDRSKSISTCVASVLENVRAGKDSLQEENLDFSHLSLHQTKRLEMEKQIRVLELESMLDKERKSLGELRKHHYQLGDSFDESPETN